MNPMKDVTRTPKVSRIKRVDLTESRRLELGDELGEHVREVDRLTEHKRTWMKFTNEVLKTHASHALRIAKLLEQGYEIVDQERVVDAEYD